MESFSPPGYVVLGLIARHGPMTPYELKAHVEESVEYFWPIPHAQLYRIPPKLVEQGLLREVTEETGRRRRTFHLTKEGRAVLRRWLADPHADDPETRDPAQLKLFFADLGDEADVVELAKAQAAQHRRWLERYQSLYEGIDPADETRRVSRARLLRLGIRHEQSYVEFWESVAADPGRL